MVVGYASGVFDLFHIGHLNILLRAKEQCDYLIAGVSTDELVYELKQREPIIPFEERLEIVANIKAVDRAVPEVSTDKLEAHELYGYDVTFKGDDWKGSEKWDQLEREFAKRGVRVHYFPYTKHTSSTLLSKVLQRLQ